MWTMPKHPVERDEFLEALNEMLENDPGVDLNLGEKTDYIPITGLVDINSPLARQRREAINLMISQHMALSGLDLTEGNKARILYLCEHSDEMDAMLRDLIRKHKEK